MKYDNLRDINLELGGGQNKKTGFLNIDILPGPGVDIVCDISQGLPLKDNSVRHVYSRHFLEHIPDTVKLMEEIYRVCQPNALVQIKVPYFKSDGAFKDPTHVKFFTRETFDYFDRSNKKLPNYNLNCNFRVEKISYLWSRPIMRIVPGKRLWLKMFWNVARTLYVELRAIK